MDSAHIRDEVATRRKYGLVGDGKDLPMQTGVAWCGENCSNMFMYLDESHALTTLKYGSGPNPCPGCLLVLRDVIDAALG